MKIMSSALLVCLFASVPAFAQPVSGSDFTQAMSKSLSDFDQQENGLQVVNDKLSSNKSLTCIVKMDKLQPDELQIQISRNNPYTDVVETLSFDGKASAVKANLSDDHKVLTATVGDNSLVMKTYDDGSSQALEIGVTQNGASFQCAIAIEASDASAAPSAAPTTPATK